MSDVELNVTELLESVIDAKIQSALTSYDNSKKTYRGVKVLSVGKDGTIWVQFPGGAEQTPANNTLVDVNPDDIVTATIENGIVTIEGNQSNYALSQTAQDEAVKSSINVALAPVVESVKDLELQTLKVDYLRADVADMKQANVERASIVDAQIQTLVAGSVTVNNKLTAAEADITALQAEDATINGKLTAVEADITNLQAADVTITGRLTAAEGVIDNLDTNYAHITDGVIDNAKIGYADVNGLNANYAHISNGVIDNAKIDQAKVENLDTYYAHITNGEIDNAKIDHANVNGLAANYATIANLNAEKARIDTIESNYVTTAVLNANVATINGLLADKADIVDLEAATADIADLKATKADISLLESDYIKTAVIEANYAKADFSNATAAWIQNGTIKNGAISNAMINDVSADKLTAGTIDASKINVTNLQAKNISVEKINGVSVSGKSIADALTQHESDISDLDSKIDDEVDALNDRIDGAIETFTGTAVPTLNNSPASGWKVSGDTTATNKNYAAHVGDVYYVVNDQIPQNGYCYRFTYIDNAYQWQLIKDSDVTAALRRLQTAESDIDGLETRTATIEQFDEEIATFKTETESELSTLMTKTTTLETNVTTAQSTANGALVENVQLWFTKANTTAPGKPTSHVSSTATTGNAWTTKVPVYNATYPHYYYCYEYKKADGSYAWSDVVHDEAMCESQAQGRKGVSDAAAAKAVADKNVKSSIQLWFTKANDTAPAKPSSQITSTATTGNAWTTKVPAYNASYPKYFYCYQYELADGTYAWSDVVEDKAMAEVQSTSRTAASNASSALTQLTTKVETSVFNEVKQTVDENSNSITTLNTTTQQLRTDVDGKASQSDLTSLTTTVNSVKQTADTNKASITSLNSTAQTLREDLDGLEIGGRNLARWTAKPTYAGNNAGKNVDSTGWYSWSGTAGITDTDEGIKAVFTGNNTGFVIPFINDDAVSGETEYVLSFDYRGTLALTTMGLYALARSGSNWVKNVKPSLIVSETEWQHAEVVFSWPSFGGRKAVSMLFPYNTTTGKWLEIRDASLKLEKGNRATDWTPAPEDVEASITEIRTTTTNKFNEVEQTIDGITTSIGEIQNDLTEKADGSTVSTLTSRVNTISDTVDGHTQTIQSVQETQTTQGNTLKTAIKSSTQLWFSKANTTAPAKPSSHVSSTATTGNAWTTAVPAYNASYPNYFYCYEWLRTDGTYDWSSVTLDIAMGESQAQARKGVSDAAAAQSTANKNVKTSVQLWFTKANDTAPGKPTSKVTTNNAATGNAWNLAVPTYNDSYKHYFYCYQYELADGTYTWSDVVYDRATTENQATSRAASVGVSTLTTKTNEISDTVDGHTQQITHVTKTANAQGTGTVDYSVMGIWEQGTTANESVGKTYDQMKSNRGTRIRFESMMPITAGAYKVTIASGYQYYTHLFDSDGKLSSMISWKSTAEAEFSVPSSACYVVFLLRKGTGSENITPEEAEDSKLRITYEYASDSELQETKADYATFKQTVNAFQSTIGTTYATKSELSQASSASEITKNAEGQREITTIDAAPLPLITLTAYGESVQNGTPSPDSPVPITCVYGLDGDNLLPSKLNASAWTKRVTPSGSNMVVSDYENGINFSWTGVGGYEVVHTTNPIPVVPGKKYKLKCKYNTNLTSRNRVANYPFGLSVRDANATTFSDDSTAETNGQYFGVAPFQLAIGSNLESELVFTPTSDEIYLMLNGGMSYDNQNHSFDIWDISLSTGSLAITCSNGNVSYLDLKGNELHGLDDTYRDQLDVLADGTVQLTKRTGKKKLSECDAAIGRYAAGVYRLRFDDMLGQDITSGTAHNNTHPLFSTNFVHTTGSSAVWSSGSAGQFTRHTVAAYPIYNHEVFFHTATDYSTVAAFLEAYGDAEIVYPLDSSYTISLGKIDLPQVDDGSVVHVAAEVQPYIDASWWTKAGYSVGRLAQQSKDAQGTLEAPYTELEWVESNGTQFVYLDWKPPMATWGFEADFIIRNAFTTPNNGWNAATNKNNSGLLFGTANASNINDIEFGAYSSSGLCRIGGTSGGSASSYDAKWKKDQTRQQIKLHGTTLTCADGSTVTVTRATEVADKPYANMTVFAYHVGVRRSGTGNLSWPGSSRIYSLKFFDGDELKVDLVGAKRKKDGMTGLYDKVKGHFYPAPNLLCGNEVGDLGEPDTVAQKLAKQNITVHIDNRDIARMWEIEVPDLDKLEDGQKIVVDFTSNISSTTPNQIAAAGIDDFAGQWDEGVTSGYGYVYLRLILSDGSKTEWIPCFYTQGTRLTSHYASGTPVPLTYHENVFYNASLLSASSITAGTPVMRGWWCDSNYYVDTVYSRSLTGGFYTGKNGVMAYTLMMKDDTGNWTSIVSNVYSTTASNKVPYSGGLQLGDVLYNSTYYNVTSQGRDINVNKSVAGDLWSSQLLDFRYSTNIYANSTAGHAMTARKPVYLVGTLNSDDGLFYLDSTQWWTQTEPVTEDGKIYIYLGLAYDWYRLVLVEEKPFYEYRDGKFMEFSYSRITKNQTDIIQTNREITLQASSTLEAAKNYTDGEISTEVENRTAAISTMSDNITASVARTYTTKTEFDNLQVGGRNLLYKSSTITGSDYGSLSSSPIDGGTAGSTKHIESTTAWSGIGYALHTVLQRSGAKIGDIVTMSVWVSNTSSEAVSRDIYLYRANTSSSVPGINNPGGDNRYVRLSLKSGEWHRVYATFEVTDYALNTVKTTRFETSVADTTNKMMWTAPKIEFGTKPTDWTPAPEDIETRVTSAEAAISVNADNITSKVSKTDYTGATVASMINQSADSVKIQAKHLQIDGTTVFGTDSTLATYLGNNYDAKGAASAVDTKITNLNDGIPRTGGLCMRANSSSYNGTVGSDNGECYFCGMDANYAPANADGWVIWNGSKVTIPKGYWINPGQKLPYGILTYCVRRTSNSTFYGVYYDTATAKWKASAYNTSQLPGAVADFTWVDSTDIILASYVEPSSEAAITGATLFDPPKHFSEIDDPDSTNAIVDVYPTAVDYVAGTATLAVRLTVNGVEKTPTSRVWTKGPSQTAIANGTGVTLNVTDLNNIYNCKVTW